MLLQVFDGDRNNIVGIVFTKDLVLVDPEDNIPVTTLLSVFNRTPMVPRRPHDIFLRG